MGDQISLPLQQPLIVTVEGLDVPDSYLLIVTVEGLDVPDSYLSDRNLPSKIITILKLHQRMLFNCIRCVCHL